MSHEVEVKFSVPRSGVRGRKSFTLSSNKKGKALQAAADYRARAILQADHSCQPADIVIDKLVIC